MQPLKCITFKDQLLHFHNFLPCNAMSSYIHIKRGKTGRQNELKMLQPSNLNVGGVLKHDIL